MVSANGQIMASTSSTDIDEARVLDISATLLSASEQLMGEMKGGVLNRITIEGSDRIIVLIRKLGSRVFCQHKYKVIDGSLTS